METNGIDLQDLFMRFTLESFVELGFGLPLNASNTDHQRFQYSFDVIQTEVELRGRKGLLWKLLPERKLKKELEWTNNLVYDIIKKRMQESHEELRGKKDLLSTALLANSGSSDKNIEELRDIVINFMVAGRDTTAVLLTWCMYMLGQHPHIELKVRREMENIVGDSDFTLENLQKLEYLHRVLQETLRLYPPVPIEGYGALKDDPEFPLPDGTTIHIPQHTTILYSAYTLHRDPSVFVNPENFDPDRFLTPPNRWTYLPFFGGPRTCLGQKMAFIEAKIMVCVLLKHYNLRPIPSFKYDLKNAIILTSANGVKMDLLPIGNVKKTI
eukprot:TRINITY_DN8028_c0_g1_i1.p1 TRINITY_DN8028_c0_g1~~TRINITY_DN8028_c0_g1_i1.p1  ORF type:complete len:334 (-),score=42.72 TRINITY_DN8028_c0_g1_i1:146-1126(-)